MSKIAAVVIDKWKLQVFMKHLDEASYTYTVGPGLTDDTLIINVAYEWVSKIKPIIEAAQTECARIKGDSQ